MSQQLAIFNASVHDKLAYATALSESNLLPAAFRQAPANVLLAIEYGQSLQIPPVTAMSTIHVIDGKPTASSALISSLVRRAGHRLRVSGNATRAEAVILRKDDPEFEFRSVWTMERAKQAGLTGKKVWQQYPDAMLKARAISEVARDACQEALYGVQYTPEELGADVGADEEPIQQTRVVSPQAQHTEVVQGEIVNEEPAHQPQQLGGREPRQGNPELETLKDRLKPLMAQVEGKTVKDPKTGDLKPDLIANVRAAEVRLASLLDLHPNLCPLRSDGKTCSLGAADADQLRRIIALYEELVATSQVPFGDKAAA